MLQYGCSAQNARPLGLFPKREPPLNRTWCAHFGEGWEGRGWRRTFAGTARQVASPCSALSLVCFLGWLPLT